MLKNATPESERILHRRRDLNEIEEGPHTAVRTASNAASQGQSRSQRRAAATDLSWSATQEGFVTPRRHWRWQDA